jgi:hypothetical protein
MGAVADRRRIDAMPFREAVDAGLISHIAAAVRNGGRVAAVVNRSGLTPSEQSERSAALHRSVVEISSTMIETNEFDLAGGLAGGARASSCGASARDRRRWVLFSLALQLWVIRGLRRRCTSWYRPPTPILMAGLQQSTYAILGFRIGATIVPSPAEGHDERRRQPENVARRIWLLDGV